VIVEDEGTEEVKEIAEVCNVYGVVDMRSYDYI